MLCNFSSSAVNYLYVHADDGGVEALLFAVKRLTTAVCVSCRKMRRKVLHDGSLIKIYTCLHSVVVSNEVQLLRYCT